MTKDELLSVIKQNLYEIIPELEDEDFSIDEKLVDLGLNSIDRGELITMTLESFESDLPRVDFVKAQTLEEIAEVFLEKA
ncbi:MAG: phosphopantetheine-binding protein [Cyclobacteriaceae bacterium]